MKNWNIRFLLIIISGVLLWSCSNENSTEPNDKITDGPIQIADYFPLSIGNFWILTKDYSNSLDTVKIIQIVNYDNVQFYKIKETIGFVIENNILHSFRGSYGELDWTVVPLIDGNMKVGEKKDYEYSYNSKLDTVTIERLDNITINVEAGSFNCVSFYESNNNYTWYFSESVGIVKVTIQRNGEIEVKNLFDYHVNN